MLSVDSKHATARAWNMIMCAVDDIPPDQRDARRRQILASIYPSKEHEVSRSTLARALSAGWLPASLRPAGV